MMDFFVESSVVMVESPKVVVVDGCGTTDTYESCILVYKSLSPHPLETSPLGRGVFAKSILPDSTTSCRLLTHRIMTMIPTLA